MDTLTRDVESDPRSYAQLKSELNKIQSLMRAKHEQVKLDFSKRLLIEAAELDIDIADLFARKGRKSKSNGAAGGPKTAIKPLYRDPANSNNVWTGRGKPKKWLADYIAAGRSKDEFKIKDVPADPVSGAADTAVTAKDPIATSRRAKPTKQ